MESDSFNHEILAGETVSGAQSSPKIGRFFQTINKYVFIIYSGSTTDRSHLKELSSDVMPHTKEPSILRAIIWA